MWYTPVIRMQTWNWQKVNLTDLFFLSLTYRRYRNPFEWKVRDIMRQTIFRQRFFWGICFDGNFRENYYTKTMEQKLLTINIVKYNILFTSNFYLKSYVKILRIKFTYKVYVQSLPQKFKSQIYVKSLRQKFTAKVYGKSLC